MATNRQALTARIELYKIGRNVKDTVTAMRLFRLRQKLDLVYQFVGERQDALMEETGVTANELGQWIYPDAETRKEFDKLNNELLDSESDIEPISIKAESVPGLNVEDIAAMFGVVEVEVEEE